MGRNIDYLRVSVTDRCPARCVYCMPKSGVDWIAHEEILSFEEILRIVSIAAELGITKIKITGGEPLARRGLIPFIERLKSLPKIEKISLTTNGVLLGEYLEKLLQAGLGAVNISLDSLNEERFKRIMNIDAFSTVKKNIEDAIASKLNVKINCVPVRGYNNDDIVSIAGLAEKNSIAVRFIELMPLGYASELHPIYKDEIIPLLQNAFGALTPCNEKLGEGPAEYYSIMGFKGKIGFISPLSHIFCASCNRLRLTSTGILKACLAGEFESDIKALLRKNRGVSIEKNTNKKITNKKITNKKITNEKNTNEKIIDEEIKELIKNTIENKPASHNFMNKAVDSKIYKPKVMSRIGG